MMLHTIQERIQGDNSQSCQGVPLSPVPPESTVMPDKIVATAHPETGVSRIACDVANIPIRQAAVSLRIGMTVWSGHPRRQRCVCIRIIGGFTTHMDWIVHSPHAKGPRRNPVWTSAGCLSASRLRVRHFACSTEQLQRRATDFFDAHTDAALLSAIAHASGGWTGSGQPPPSSVCVSHIGGRTDTPHRSVAVSKRVIRGSPNL